MMPLLRIIQAWCTALLLVSLRTTAFSLNGRKERGSQTAAFSINGSKKPRILVLRGETGFVGKAVVDKLQTMGVPYITASRSTGVDLTAPDAMEQVKSLAKGCTAVISTVGSIGQGDQDERVNAANGMAARAARQAGCSRFVVIGNDPRVQDFARGLPALQGYAAGKKAAEDVIRQEFPDAYTVVQPTFIYGGEDFSVNPPRVSSNIGQVAEDILGLYPLQAVSQALPGILGVATAAPVSVQRVAAAAVNAALGVVQESELSTREAIVQAASLRPRLATTSQKKQSLASLKQALYDLGNCEGEAECLENAFQILEQIEVYNFRKPASDPLLNGRWDFCFDVEADAGTGVLRDILDGNSPIAAVFNVDDLYMEISNNNRVTIYVKVRLIGGLIPMDVKVTTNLNAVADDATGTRFEEQFVGLSLTGIDMPVPASWQQFRPLEFSYLDENMLIARGNGGEPHYLKR